PDVLLVAREQAVVHDPELAGQLLELLALGAVPDHAEAGVDALVAQEAERTEHVGAALDAGHATDPADEESVLRHAHDPARTAARRPIAPALAVCVWMMCGRCSRIIFARRKVASRSRRGEISRWRWGMIVTGTPCSSAT